MGFRRTEVVHDFQLTDAELEIAHQIDSPDLKKILRREGVSIGAHTTAYLKVVARLRAERMAYEELNRLRDARGQLVSLAHAEEVIAEANKQNRALQRELEKERANHVKELAAPAMAVHSEPTGR